MRIPGLTAVSLLLAAIASTASAALITGRIAPREDGTNIRLSPSTTVLLDRGSAGQTLIRRDGTFSLYDVPTGNYVLSFSDKDWLFPEYAVTVTSEGAVVAKPHRAGELPTPHLKPVPYPLVVRPTGAPVFKEAKKAFSLLGLIMGNPMYLLMAGGGLLVFLMPKLMAQLDPEALKEAQANQAELHKQMGSFQNMDFGSSMAKMLSGGAAEQETKAQTSGRSSGGNARKRK